MAEIISPIQVKEKRSEKRKSIDRFYCVEIDIGSPLPIYQFKVRNISGHRACILVKEDSSILKSLEIGQKLKMNYWAGENLGTTKTWHVQIKHITKQIHGSLKGHFLVYFSIINKSG
jgi:hypothetical protein